MMSDPRAASTTSLVTTSIRLTSRMRVIWANSLWMRRKLPPVVRTTAATASGSLNSPDGTWSPSSRQWVRHDRGDLVRRERPELVGESDSAVELRVAGQTPLHPGHADQ